MPMPSNEPVSLEYWNRESKGGWKYLLPPLHTLSVACFSTRPQWAVGQAPQCGSLTLLHDSRLIGLAPHSEVVAACQGKVEVLSVDALFDSNSALSPAPRFDGFLIHDPEGSLLHSVNFPRISELLPSLVKLLRPGAFVYLGVRNSHGLPRLAALTRGQLKLPSLPLAKALGSLRTARFDYARVHAYLSSGNSLTEVIPQRGYRASKNRERFAERAKELVYGRFGSRVLAPAYGIVAFAGPTADSTLDLVMKKVAAATYYTSAEPPVVKHYLLFQGSKAIVTLGPATTEQHDVVAILSGDELAIERRQVESAVLAELSKLPQTVAKLVPRALDHFTIGRTHCFVVNRLPGVTLDVDSGALDTITARALDFVIDLHRASTQRVSIDETNYRRFFGSLLEAAQTRNPSVAATVTAWDAPLRRCVMGITLPTVWMHGDYKVENVMYDQARRELTGVIDWELAQGPGLPLLDPMYLLFYNRLIRGEEHLDALRDLLLRDRRRTDEQSMLKRYCAAIGLPVEASSALCAMYVAHHIGCRLHFYSDDSLRELDTLATETLAMLERAAASADPARSRPPIWRADSS
jgi:aminoglycoside phosphotransferase (APT) family kinase protein